nr:hypothetical protein [Polaromonas sp.]
MQHPKGLHGKVKCRLMPWPWLHRCLDCGPKHVRQLLVRKIDEIDNMSLENDQRMPFCHWKSVFDGIRQFIRRNDQFGGIEPKLGRLTGRGALGGLGHIFLAHLVVAAFADAEPGAVGEHDLLGPAQRLLQGAAVLLLGFRAGIVWNLREILKGDAVSHAVQYA